MKHFRVLEQNVGAVEASFLLSLSLSLAENPQPLLLAGTLHPLPSTTLHPQPSTLDHQPSTHNPQHSTLNPQPSGCQALQGAGAERGGGRGHPRHPPGPLRSPGPPPSQLAALYDDVKSCPTINFTDSITQPFHGSSPSPWQQRSPSLSRGRCRPLQRARHCPGFSHGRGGGRGHPRHPPRPVRSAGPLPREFATFLLSQRL